MTLLIWQTAHRGGRNRKKDARLIGVIGCMAERMGEELLRDYGVDFVAGPDAYMDIPNLLSQCEQGLPAINIELSKTETYREVMPARIGKQISGFVSIMRGCNNFCSYCVVPYTRGRERSRDVESIKNEVLDLQTSTFWLPSLPILSLFFFFFFLSNWERSILSTTLGPARRSTSIFTSRG